MFLEQNSSGEYHPPWEFQVSKKQTNQFGHWFKQGFVVEAGVHLETIKRSQTDSAIPLQSPMNLLNFSPWKIVMWGAAYVSKISICAYIS